MEEDPSGLRYHFRYLPPEQENTIKSVINLYNMGQIFPIENLFNALKKEKTRLKKRREKKEFPSPLRYRHHNRNPSNIP